jgi:hypothetical protein
MIGAGAFTADPALGFPLGTPAESMTVSTHGLLHLACAGVGFLGLIAASIMYGRGCLAAGRPVWGAYSIGTGVVFLVTFFSGAALAGAAAARGGCARPAAARQPVGEGVRSHAAPAPRRSGPRPRGRRPAHAPASPKGP